jgi:hypothetical protein
LQPSVVIPQSQIYLSRPGSMVPVQAWINGAAARSNCSSSSSAVFSTATPPAPASDASEPTTFAAAGPACGYFPSSYLTPVITSFAVSGAPDSVAPSLLTLNGALLTNQTGDVTITVGGEQCSITEVAANGSSVSCTFPALQAGDAAIMLAQAGYAAMPGGGNTIRINTPLIIRSLSPSRGSYHGGVLLSVAGSGFARFPSNSSVQMEVTVIGTAPGPVTPAMASSTNTLATIRLPYYKAGVTAATRHLTLQLRVFDHVSNTTIASAAVPYTLDIAYTPSVSGATPAILDPFTAGNITLSWSVGAAAAGVAGANDSLPAGTASVAKVFLQSGSNGRVYACGLVPEEGANPQVLVTTSSFNSTAGSYQGSISCQMPATLPAAGYDVWVCLEGVGCGFAAAAVRVPVNVSSISRSAGSIAGGTELVITGTGKALSLGQKRCKQCTFQYHSDMARIKHALHSAALFTELSRNRILTAGVVPAILVGCCTSLTAPPVAPCSSAFSPEVGAVAVTFGNSSCSVTAVKTTAITCITAALAANMTAGQAYAAVVTPSQVRQSTTGRRMVC